MKVSVHHQVSPLSAGILRAVLYDDGHAWDNCRDLYGQGMMLEAQRVLPELLEGKNGNGGAPVIVDCRCVDWREWMRAPGATVICLCDQSAVRHPDLPAHVLRRDARKGEPLFPAFPHRWPMLERRWSSGFRPWVVKPSVGFCGVTSRPDIRAKAVTWLRLSDRLDPVLIEREKFMGFEVGRVRARQEYQAHLLGCDYQLCVRGVGNWDYRLYETLCASCHGKFEESEIGKTQMNKLNMAIASVPDMAGLKDTKEVDLEAIVAALSELPPGKGKGKPAE